MAVFYAASVAHLLDDSEHPSTVAPEDTESAIEPAT
jgi:hypothetical protein